MPNNTESILDQLKQPLDVKRVKKRQGGGGNQLSYIEAHDAISTLNRIFGYDGWNSKLLNFQSFQTPKGMAYRQEVLLTVNFDGRFVTKEDVGIGIASLDKQGNLTAEQIEKGMKEAVSDGLKRAARMLGEQFGNELYDKLAPEHRGEQQASRATTAQLQECEALRQKAVQLGFRAASGAEPRKMEDGVAESTVLGRSKGFREYIQEHGDKGSDETLSSTTRIDALNAKCREWPNYKAFVLTWTDKGYSWATDEDVAAFENAATPHTADGLPVIAEHIGMGGWSEWENRVLHDELGLEVKA